jgi:hypothetical protein
VPTPAAIVVVASLCVLSGVFDLRGSHTLGIPFDTAYILGSLAAVIAVKRSGVFILMCTPPLMTILAAVVGVLLFTSHRNDSTATLLATATPVITQFPVTAGTTALTVIIGTVRLIRDRRAGTPTPGDDAATIARSRR